MMAAALAYIPTWRGDETLYSWVAGFHAVFGNGSSRDTGALFFTAEHACREHDAPANLHRFVEVTNGHLGDALTLLRTRCPLGLYFPFLSENRRRLMQNMAQGAGVASWRALFGMAATSLTTAGGLRFCDACVRDDLATWGLPRWRLPHQLSGSWMCTQHRRMLIELPSVSSKWAIPTDTYRTIQLRLSGVHEEESIYRIAKLAQHVHSATALDIDTIRQVTHVGLRERGIVKWTHGLDREQLSKWFAETPLANWLKFQGDSQSKLASGQWIHDLLRNRRGHHPVKWMLLWCSLFSDDDEDRLVHRFVHPHTAPYWRPDGQGCLWETCDSTVPPAIQQLIEKSPTLEAAAHLLGMSSIALRKKLLALGVRAGDFRQLDSFGRRREKAIGRVRDYIDQHPGCGRSDIHAHCKTAVSWIQKNEPALYHQLVSQVQTKSRSQLTLCFEQR